ncbi:hypothetical protein [Streptomyces sp. WMMB 322]|uniref:hypothetical protein n=1 Tax=Streptomyces sp. WMMB 322 TaxID=1286821 RepID=UPI0006E35B6C|nr:hypothetical protein [Streptomyces sp. WMMB 322]SCK31464.1 hypothetical protein H180DRAFT_02505 [Streptomyces sp. WMMB 322]
MAGFLDRAKEQAQRGLAQGKEKMEVVQAQRTSSDLLRKLGAAYYSEQREDGSRADVEQAMTALEQHIAQHGKDFLKST